VRYDDILSRLELIQAGLRQDKEFAHHGGRYALEQCSRRREHLLAQLAENDAREHRILSRLYRISRTDIEHEQLVVRIAIQLVQAARSKGLPVVDDPLTMVRNVLNKKGQLYDERIGDDEREDHSVADRCSVV